MDLGSIEVASTYFWLDNYKCINYMRFSLWCRMWEIIIELSMFNSIYGCGWHW